MELKHPNDPAVAWLLKAFEKELRDGWHTPGSAETVLERIRQLDDEAETRWQAILKKEAAEAENARIVELEKLRAEKAAAAQAAEWAKWRAMKDARLGIRYAPGAIVGCSICSHITPPTPHFRVEEVEERMALLADAIKALQDSGEACRPSKKPASLVVSELRRAKAVLANILADATVSEYAKHHLKYSHNRLCKAIHRFAQEGTGND